MNWRALAIFLSIFAIIDLTGGFRLAGSRPNKINSHKKDDLKARAEKTLVLSHVLFRHGARTPELSELYPNDPYFNYNYYPLRHGDLTNQGKREEYEIGIALRKRYNSFLSEYYVSNELDPWSTDRNRTKMSLLLVLASLFPPKCSEKWDANLNWQPVPYNYRQEKDDPILFGISCPNYVKELAAAEQLPEVRAEFDQYAETMDYISEHTGLNITRFEQVYYMFFGLSTEETYGLKLPSWTEKVWPEPFQEISFKQYSVYTRTTNLKKVAAGYLLQKIIDDTDRKIKNESDFKLHLYSAHENNIGQLFETLELFEYPHIPTFGSYVLMEIHYINGTYGLMIYYQNYKSTYPKLLKLPACEDFCPFDTFKELVQEYIPENGLCGN